MSGCVVGMLKFSAAQSLKLCAAVARLSAIRWSLVQYGMTDWCLLVRRWEGSHLILTRKENLPKRTLSGLGSAILFDECTVMVVRIDIHYVQSANL